MARYLRQIAIKLEARRDGADGRKVYPSVLSTEVAVKRSDWQRGTFDEVLSHKASAVNLARAPLPVLVSHDRWSLPVGIVDNLRVVDGKLRGDVSFGMSEKAREIEADVAVGIIRNLSIGYTIERADEHKNGDKTTITAVRWTPHELSIVAVGADAGAGFGRSKGQMDENEIETTTGQETRDAAALIERERCAGITRTARALGLSGDMAEKLINDGVTLDKARTALIDAYEQARPPLVSDAGRARSWEPPMQGRGSATETGPDFRAAASDALLLRAGMVVDKPHPAARDVDGSILEIARVCVSRAGMTDKRSGSPDSLLRRAMTTSDFPLILTDAMHKSLRRGYEDEPASHRQWVRVTNVSDFRDQHRPILGSAPELDKLIEHGEYKDGSMTEDSTSYKIAKYGKIVSLTWETMVNDNLSAFLRVQPAMGQAARRKEADTVYALLAENSAAGPTMQDGVVLFHANHNNLGTSGAMDAATLGSARTLLRKQTAVGGGYLSLVPRFLIVPPDLETDAELTLARATRIVTENSEADTPQWIARLELVVEPRLPGNAIYLAADNAQIDTVELGVLDENAGGPTFEEEREFRKDVYSWKVRHVFGAKVLDWRGLVKIPIA